MDYPLVRFFRFRLLFAAVIAAGFSGCGSEDTGLLPVSGQVIYDGKPLTTGTVSFHPVGTTGHVPTGSIDKDGRYTLSTNYQPGAPPGKYKVVINATEPVKVVPGKANPGLPKSIIPRRYNQASASPFEVEVKVDAAQDAYDLRLDKEAAPP
jgi:hypothetical protein